MKFLRLFFTVLSASLLSSCANDKVVTKESTPEVLAPKIDVSPLFERAVSKVNIKEYSYGYGRQIYSRAAQHGLPQLNEDKVIANYLKAKGGAEVDMAAIQQSLYQIRRSGPTSPESLLEASANIGLLLGTRESKDYLKKHLDVAEFTLGFKDAKTFQKRSELNYDSIVDMTGMNFQLELGEAYIEEFKQKEGVVTTESGLTYFVLNEGSGEKPKNAQAKVKTHYEGTLINGEIFDSSYKRGEPIEFNLGGVIPGWTEGLQYMTPGSKYRFVIPQELAYGSRAAGSIPAYSTLIFDVELIEVFNPEM